MRMTYAAHLEAARAVARPWSRPARRQVRLLLRLGLTVLVGTGTAARQVGLAARAVARPGIWLGPLLVEARRQITDALGLVLLLAVLGGALIAQQTGYQFQGTLPSWIVGSIVAASLVTEMTPLFTGFALVGMIGTRMAAELGAMRVTEQVDALEVMGRDPLAYLVLPRVGGAIVAAPVLMAFALVASMLSGWGSAVVTTRADSADFWFGVRHYMRDFPLFFALIKSVAFGAAVAVIGCTAGLTAGGGATGVGQATRRAVVAMIAAIILLDTALVPLLKVVRV
jgi:phospholipid/cholesterol/gamma-HCH transport system permease protein